MSPVVYVCVCVEVDVVTTDGYSKVAGRYDPVPFEENLNEVKQAVSSTLAGVRLCNARLRCLTAADIYQGSQEAQHGSAGDIPL